MAIEYATQDAQVIREMLCKLLGRESGSIDIDEDIYLAGLTSIMVLPLLIDLENAFQVIVPDAPFMEARTVRGLAQLIAELRGKV